MMQDTMTGGAEAPQPDPRAAELARLAGLSAADYQMQRAPSAQKLGMGVGALDKAVQAERARQKAEQAAAYRSAPPPQHGEVREPFGFFRRGGALYADMGTTAPPLWLAAEFDVLGETRDHAGEEWGLLLRWYDRDGNLHTYPLPQADLMVAQGVMEAELARRGLRLSPDPQARQRLRQYLGEVQAGSRVRLAYACGWQGTQADAAYLLPDGTVLGETVEPVVPHAMSLDAAHRCGTAGSLDGWKAQVAALAAGNPLATFCLSAAFVGPLLLPAAEPGGGFHITGPSKRGKTLAVQMGVSAWARAYKDRGGLRDWRSTANALEVAAEEAGDGLLALDELHQANPAEVAGAAYMLADGSGKSRLNRDANSRRRRSWRTCILSTGEHDLAAHIGRIGQKLPAGAEVRLPSIPVAELGTVWPALHGRASFEALARDIHAGMQRHHGEAARVFIAQLAAERTAGGVDLETALATMRSRMMAALPSGADPQVRDVARRCALVATAGELAAAWGILPWAPGEAEAAARTMLIAWLSRRGAGAGEAAAQVQAVRAAILAHGSSRFTALHKNAEGRWYEANPERSVINRLGWRKSEGDARDVFLIPPDLWRTEVCAPACIDPQATAKALAEAGFLIRGEGNNLGKKETVPGMGTIRVYAISAALVQAVEDGAVPRAEAA